MIDPTTGEIVGDLATGYNYEQHPQKTYMPVFLRTPYNYDRDAASNETALTTPEPTRTQQQFRDEVDINTLVDRFGLTPGAQWPMLERVPLQADFVPTTDYKTAMDTIIAANETFMQLPATQRERFDNDPHKWLEFTSDPKNEDEMRSLGILKPKPAPIEPMAVRVVADEPPKA